MTEKIIFFDTGPIISLVMSRLVWILPKLKEKYGGKFYITPSVKRELVERPMSVKRFEFEALQALKLIEDGVLEIYHNVPKRKTTKLINLANTSFKIKNKYMDIIQAGEMDTLAAALEVKAEAIVLDERTLRLLIESSHELEKLLEIRFRKDVVANKDKLNLVSRELSGMKVIRSMELVAVAYEMGMLDYYLPKLKKGRETLLDSVLWAVKTNGCAATSREIEAIKKFLL